MRLRYNGRAWFRVFFISTGGKVRLFGPYKTAKQAASALDMSTYYGRES